MGLGKKASIIKGHISGTEIVSPAIKEIIKEEKIKYLRHKVIIIIIEIWNSFGVYDGFDSSIYQLVQAIQKIVNG
jgi:hypothetical protein